MNLQKKKPRLYLPKDRLKRKNDREIFARYMYPVPVVILFLTVLEFDRLEICVLRRVYLFYTQ